MFGDITYYVNTSDQISFTTKENIKITFLWYYFKPLRALIPTSSLALSSREDIIADKAHTIGRRAAWRDYVDMFYILKSKAFDLSRIVHLAQKKFKAEFVVTQFLEQLRYFNDITVVPIEFVKNTYSPEEIKTYLEQTVEDYLKINLYSS